MQNHQVIIKFFFDTVKFFFFVNRYYSDPLDEVGVVCGGGEVWVMKIKFIVQCIKKRSPDLLKIISKVVCNITTLSCNSAMKWIYGGLVQRNFSMFMLLKISLDNPCTCISCREKMSSGNWFLRIKKFFFDFSFCLQLNILRYIVIISKTLTEKIWDLTLRLNPVRYEVKSVKCYEYI